MLQEFVIGRNDFLKKTTDGYFSLYYTGYRSPNNPDFLNKLKNKNNDESIDSLQSAQQQVETLLLDCIPAIMKLYNLQSCICISVPRAKALCTYTPNQLFLRDAIKNSAMQTRGVIDGTDAIIRHLNTKTTHLDHNGKNVGRMTSKGWEDTNDGERPYPGITKDTCYIDTRLIRGRAVILIDDIYTSGANIDEDCIQALLDAGASYVIFYAIAYTRR